MTERPTETRTAIVDAINAVAPEIAPDELTGTADLVDELELDSMDLLNIAVGVYERTGIDIPERDFPKLRTIDAMATYIDEASAEPN